MRQEIPSLSTERVPVILLEAWKRVSLLVRLTSETTAPWKFTPVDIHLQSDTWPEKPHASFCFAILHLSCVKINHWVTNAEKHFIMFTDVNLEAVLATATADSVQQRQAKKSLKTPDSEKSYCNSYTVWPKFKHDTFLLRPKTNSCLTGMDAGEEALSLLNKIWEKLQGLPDATPVELGAFFILLTFICEF